ncbi:MAG TPA: RNA polymerase sigma factor [Actinomycetota bacterium]|nr:RNA polymerase sigma factor [Actinomycetota bacterium]
MLVALRDETSARELPDELLATRSTDDLDAFTELYDRYHRRVYRFVRSQTPDDATAEDLTAQTFFRALSSAGTFDGRGSYKSWLFRIAHNTVSSWRLHRTKSPIVLEEVPEHVDPSPSPASVLVAGEERSLVWRVVSSLAPAQREAISLRYIEDLTTEEIAEITGRSRGAVRILLHRGRIALRRAFEERGILVAGAVAGAVSATGAVYLGSRRRHRGGS